MKDKLKLAFEPASLRIPLSQILPLRPVPDNVKKSVKYAQIAASIKEVGIIEPPVVIRDAGEPNTYHLLDGHLRIEVLKDEGISAVVCLISTEDEAYTYNKRINRLAIIQEHRMIMTAARSRCLRRTPRQGAQREHQGHPQPPPTAGGNMPGGGRDPQGQACRDQHVP
jgi:hypothetical protein